MGFSRQEYRSGLLCLPPRDLPNPGIEPTSPVAPVLQVDSFTAEPPGKPLAGLYSPVSGPSTQAPPMTLPPGRHSHGFPF